ncbi:phage major capsid protein [Mizugakiibacter sediminis]|uniref:Capsid protein n=1 Tax=Mizugakiibacter sediminis TaxID=1475481 RepID=A0A0K8QPI2_9GAMM|nr:phage major capsid protein [Mizugakiibacter sediminis]GAP66800.1 phage major capsid protein [Mizugakiibacter sediminis]
MSNSLKALRERHDALAREVKNLCEQNPGATWNHEHQATYDAKMTEIEDVRAEIRRLEQVAALEFENAARDAGVRVTDAPDAKPGIFGKWLRGGDTALSAQEWQAVRNTMSTGTGSEGGYSVETTVAAELLKALKAYGGMRSVATVFHTSQGNPMNWPTMDDTGNVGELVAENTPAGSQDAAFGTVGLNVYKFSSKVVTVPIELLQDSQIDIEATVIQLLAERLARIQNTYFTTGSGISQPRGIVTGASAGKVGATGETATFIYDDLVDLEHSLDPAYRNLPGVGYMMSDAALKVVRKIKDSQGRPIFVPGYEANAMINGGAPGTLMGRPITINQDIAAPAASAKSVLFGVLNNYRIRDVMAATVFRFTDSAYTKNGQVGFLAWQRSGGNLLDNSGATVKYFQHSAT